MMIQEKKRYTLKSILFFLSRLYYYYQRQLRQFIPVCRDAVQGSVRYSADLILASRLVGTVGVTKSKFQIPNSQIFAAIVAVMAFASCKVGKEYKRPDLELPQQFNNVSFADTSSIADIEWKKFFTDPDLQNLISKGLAYNQDLLIAMKNMEIAQQRMKQAKLILLPDLNAQITAQTFNPSNNSLNGISANSFLGKNHVENYQAAVNLTWEVDIWGKLRNQKEATLAQYLQTYEASKAVQTQLVSDIAQGYFNLLMLDKQLEVTKSNLALNDTFFRATQLLRDAGLANSLAVERAASQKQTTELLIPQLEQDIAIQENALQVLAGQLPTRVSRSTALQNFVVPDYLSAGLPVSMVSRRPDVRSNEMALMAANAQVGVAQANMYPALNITAGAGFESFKSSNWFNIPSSIFGIAAGAIAQPIFERRRLKTEFEVAKLQREQAVIQFRQSVLVATQEVSDALVQLDKLKQQRNISVAQTDTLRLAVDNAKLLYKADLANYLEVITAQTARLQSELYLASVQRQELAAMVELYRSLGGGWK
jgi:NodT family efflux transporter outer membrane factor (OMF) lipoprotein